MAQFGLDQPAFNHIFLVSKTKDVICFALVLINCKVYASFLSFFLMTWNLTKVRPFGPMSTLGDWGVNHRYMIAPTRTMYQVSMDICSILVKLFSRVVSFPDLI